MCPQRKRTVLEIVSTAPQPQNEMLLVQLWFVFFQSPSFSTPTNTLSMSKLLDIALHLFSGHPTPQTPPPRPSSTHTNTKNPGQLFSISIVSGIRNRTLLCPDCDNRRTQTCKRAARQTSYRKQKSVERSPQPQPNRNRRGIVSQQKQTRQSLGEISLDNSSRVGRVVFVRWLSSPPPRPVYLSLLQLAIDSRLS